MESLYCADTEQVLLPVSVTQSKVTTYCDYCEMNVETWFPRVQSDDLSFLTSNQQNHKVYSDYLYCQ